MLVFCILCTDEKQFPLNSLWRWTRSCLPGRSPGYQGLQEKQIRAIHTGSFLSASASPITPGGAAVTPAGSNPCLPRMCVCPRRCGSWKPRLSLWFLAPAVVSQIGHHITACPAPAVLPGESLLGRISGKCCSTAASSFAGAFMALPRGMC